MENNIIKDNVPQNLDESPVWLKNVKHGTTVCIPRYQLLSHKKKLDLNGDHIFVETEPEFVPKKKINPLDDEKKASASKRANTDKTMSEIQDVTQGSKDEIMAFAKEKEVSLAGCKNKKEMLEKLEEAGVLY